MFDISYSYYSRDKYLAEQLYKISLFNRHISSKDIFYTVLIIEVIRLSVLPWLTFLPFRADDFCFCPSWEQREREMRNLACSLLYGLRTKTRDCRGSTQVASGAVDVVVGLGRVDTGQKLSGDHFEACSIQGS